MITQDKLWRLPEGYTYGVQTLVEGTGWEFERIGEMITGTSICGYPLRDWIWFGPKDMAFSKFNELKASGFTTCRMIEVSRYMPSGENKIIIQNIIYTHIAEK